MSRKNLILSLGVSLLVVITALSWYFRADLSAVYYAQKTQKELAASGVTEITAPGGLHGLERNSCPQGEGEECLCVFLIHGMGDSSVTWRKIMTLLTPQTEGTRMIALDLPGMGKSEMPSDPAELQVSAIAARFNQYLSSLGCEKTTVVGNSFGGWIAYWMAIDFNRPEWGTAAYTLARVVSLGGTGLKGSATDEEFFKRLREEPTIEGLKEFQRRAYFKPREYPETFWKAALTRAQASRGAGSLADAQKEDQYFDGKVQVLPVELHYYWGEADQIVPRSMGEGLERAFPGSKFLTIPECGHLPQKECPEQVISAIFSEP